MTDPASPAPRAPFVPFAAAMPDGRVLVRSRDGLALYLPSSDERLIADMALRGVHRPLALRAARALRRPGAHVVEAGSPSGVLALSLALDAARAPETDDRDGDGDRHGNEGGAGVVMAVGPTEAVRHNAALNDLGAALRPLDLAPDRLGAALDGAGPVGLVLIGPDASPGRVLEGLGSGILSQPDVAVVLAWRPADLARPLVEAAMIAEAASTHGLTLVRLGEEEDAVLGSLADSGPCEVAMVADPGRLMVRGSA